MWGGVLGALENFSLCSREVEVIPDVVKTGKVSISILTAPLTITTLTLSASTSC